MSDAHVAKGVYHSLPRQYAVGRDQFFQLFIKICHEDSCAAISIPQSDEAGVGAGYKPALSLDKSFSAR
jgi:hypothetical protein